MDRFCRRSADQRRRIFRKCICHGAGIYDAGVLKMAGEIDLDTAQEIYLEENQKIQVTDALSTVSGTLLVDFPTARYENRHVVAEYAEGLTPEKELYILKQAAVMTERNLSLSAEGQQVLLSTGYPVTYDLTNATKGDPAPVRVAHGAELIAQVKAREGISSAGKH